MVSAGKSDTFATVAPKNEWDICAGDCLVKEAGGIINDIVYDYLLWQYYIDNNILDLNMEIKRFHSC